MTGDVTQFTNLKLKAEGHVTYGDNNRGRILRRGNVGIADSTTIENVLCVEGLKHSLLSISQLFDKGYKVNFEANTCKISNEISGKVLFTGKKNQSSELDATNQNSVKESTVNAGWPKEWKTPRDLTLDNVIGKIEKGVSTRNSLNNFCRTVAFVSQIEPKSLEEALQDINWIIAMQEELKQFEYNEVQQI
ncbi:uncharacterized protein [Phaseolus vulgaris]|uniref:uncharacterized protein n=1 Tax=Phaseolus vulgaris TaxID=3885 RepID=UPI0035CA8957